MLSKVRPPRFRHLATPTTATSYAKSGRREFYDLFHPLAGLTLTAYHGTSSTPNQHFQIPTIKDPPSSPPELDSPVLTNFLSPQTSTQSTPTHTNPHQPNYHHTKMRPTTFLPTILLLLLPLIPSALATPPVATGLDTRGSDMFANGGLLDNGGRKHKLHVCVDSCSRAADGEKAWLAVCKTCRESKSPLPLPHLIFTLMTQHQGKGSSMWLM